MMIGSNIIMLMLMLMMIIEMNVGVLVIESSFWNDEEQIRATSGEDDIEKNEVLVLEKFRVFLGLSSLKQDPHANPYRQEWVDGSPAPAPLPRTHLLKGESLAPAPAPGPIPASAARVKPHHYRPPRPMLPIQRLGHHHKENVKRKRVMIAVLVSIAVAMLICSCGVFWVTKRIFKHQKDDTKSVSLCGEKSAQTVALATKVRHDPGFGVSYPTTTTNNNNDNEASVGLELEPQIETKHGPGESNCSFSVEEIISVHEYAESSKYESDGQNSLKSDNIIGSANHNSSEDQSFHSLSDSRSFSNLRLSNVSLGSFSDPVELFSPTCPDRSPSSAPTIDDSSCNTTPGVEKENPTSSHINIPNYPPPPPPPPPPPSTVAISRTKPPMQDNSPRSSVILKTTEAPSNIPPPPCPPPFPSKTGTCSKGPPPPPPFSPMGKDGSPLPKLKPLHWDKVRAAPDRSMVWDQLRCNSFELDEEMIESLFGYNLQSAFKNQEGSSKSPSPSKHVLEPKRLQNITILSKALNVTAEKVCEALVQGEGLGTQQLEALVKMAPTKEEEGKLTSYKGNINELGSAEKLVKKMLIIPHAFQRIETMLYRATFDDEVVHLRNSFSMLEEACKELRSSRLFLKLLEAVLKTGNRMNVGTIRGGARAFKLDALLKLADVKGTDGKTTLLHFVVQEIVRSEGIRMSDSIMGQIDRNNKSRTVEEKEDDYRRMGLELVSGLSTELCNVKRTASIDLDVLATSVSNLSDGLNKLQQLINKNLFKDAPHDDFVNVMKIFSNHAEKNLSDLQTEEEKVLLSVRQITEYYHGDVSKDEVNPLRIFVIVRDFMGMLDQVCRELKTMKTPTTPNRLAPFK